MSIDESVRDETPLADDEIQNLYELLNQSRTLRSYVGNTLPRALAELKRLREFASAVASDWPATQFGDCWFCSATLHRDKKEPHASTCPVTMLDAVRAKREGT